MIHTFSYFLHNYAFYYILRSHQFTTPWDAVTLARFSQALATVVGGTSLFLAYKRYKPVKAVKTLESGQNLYIAGVTELWHTITDLGKTEPGAQRYLLAVAFLAASVGSFTNLAITYLTEEIQMSGTQVVIFILINFVTNPLGVIAHRTIARRIGHKKNYVLVNAWFILITALFIGTIAGPEHTNYTYLFSVLYGIGYGWYYPSSNGFFISLVPEDRVTELWGFNMFASVVLSWVPPLVFTALNESTGNLRMGLLGMVIFQVVGLLITLTIPEKVKGDEQSGIKVDVEEKGDAVDSNSACTPPDEGIEVVVE